MTDSQADAFSDLDHDTAIRLRWIVRDIRGGRITSPSEDDIALLERLGMITLNDGEIALTAAANLVI